MHSGRRRSTAGLAVAYPMHTELPKHGKQKPVTYAWYGMTAPAENNGQKQVCELDHLVPLELGGADGLGNIWPQCGPDESALKSRFFKRKDLAENYLAARSFLVPCRWRKHSGPSPLLGPNTWSVRRATKVPGGINAQKTAPASGAMGSYRECFASRIRLIFAIMSPGSGHCGRQ